MSHQHEKSQAKSKSTRCSCEAARHREVAATVDTSGGTGKEQEMQATGKAAESANPAPSVPIANPDAAHAAVGHGGAAAASHVGVVVVGPHGAAAASGAGGVAIGPDGVAATSNSANSNGVAVRDGAGSKD